MADEIRRVDNPYRIDPARKKYSQEEKNRNADDFRDLLGHSAPNDEDVIQLEAIGEDEPGPERDEMLQDLSLKSGPGPKIEEIDVEAELARRRAEREGAKAAPPAEQKEGEGES